MKFLIALAALVAVAAAFPQSNPADAQATIVRQESDVAPDGSFQNAVETSNKIIAAASGVLKSVPGAEAPSSSQKGSYTFTAPDGVTYTVNWEADENGFRADGAHLPKNP